VNELYEIVHLVGFHYKNISRRTVLWMSKSNIKFAFICFVRFSEQTAKISLTSD